MQSQACLLERNFVRRVREGRGFLMFHTILSRGLVVVSTDFQYDGGITARRGLKSETMRGTCGLARLWAVHKSKNARLASSHVFKTGCLKYIDTLAFGCGGAIGEGGGER